MLRPVHPFRFHVVWSEPLIDKFCYAKYRKHPDFQFANRAFASVFNGKATNIIFSNGGFDPIRGYAPGHNLTRSLLAVNIPDAGHTLDLFGNDPWSPLPQEVLDAQAQELRIFRQWLCQG